MSAMSVEVPYPVFTDRAGEPLENGYVWIGVANQNPQTNPLQVYFDRNLTQPAAQPLRTIAGYVSNAGTPAQIYVDAVNYSILAQDKNGTMVYNFADGTGIPPFSNGACDLDYTPDFQNSVTRPTCEKLEESVSVKDFGAVGNGIADDTTAIQTAIAYCWTQYKRVFPPGIGKTFPAQSVKLVFPDGVYRITSTLNIANGLYEVINYEGQGNATILWDGGSGVAVRAIATTSQGIVTTPISWTNISIRKAGIQKQANSVAFQCERYSNFTVKGMGILGFDIGVLNQGAIDMHYDFDNRAIEGCNIGFLTEQKTVSAGIMKPNLLTITNAYFIECSKFSFWARRNPAESVVNNGCGSVITIENTNFQGNSAVAVNCEYTGEVPEYGNVTLRNSWFEFAGARLIRLNRARMLLDNCFIFPQATGGYPISLETTSVPGAGVRSRITLINCDSFQFNSQANNTFIHGFANTDPHTTVDSYLNDVFSTASLVGLVTSMNMAMKAGAGVSHRLYLGQPTGEGDYPRFQASLSEVPATMIYTAKGSTASLAPAGNETIFNMGTLSGLFQVSAIQNDGGIVWRVSAEVFSNGAGSTSINTKASSNITVTSSGTNIVLTNTGPSNMALRWTVTRILS
jgi:hypothetical protein